MTITLNRRAGVAETADPIVSPVTSQELEDWLSLHATENVLPRLLAQATGAVVRYIGHDLIARNWTLTHWDWPAQGTLSARNLGRDTGGAADVVAIPYGPLSITSVLRYGEAVTDYVFRSGEIAIGGAFSGPMVADPALVVAYRAGFGETAATVPEEIRQAVLMLAAFNYEHRGSCEASEAMRKSGAAEALTPWRSAELFI